MAVGIVASLILTNRPASAQTVPEFLAMTRTQQDEAIQVVVDRTLRNLSSDKQLNGTPKTADEAALNRRMANITRAVMTPDPDQASQQPYGFALVRTRARQLAEKQPEQTVAGIAVEILSLMYKRVEHPAWLAERPDSYQEAYYRLQVQVVRSKAQADQLDRRLAAQEAAASKKLEEIWQSATVLADGRRVLPDDKGEFRIITRDGKPPDGTILTGPAKQEAQRIAVCLNAGRSQSQCR
jgi:hypothetical protein